MESMLSEIYEALSMNGMLPPTTGLDEEYGRLGNMEDELERRMDGEMRKAFTEFMCLRVSVEQECSRQRFVYGVRMGMQLMLDAMLEREKQKHVTEAEERK